MVFIVYNDKYFVAVEGDIIKCFEEGKALIIEGSHIDPHFYMDLIKHEKAVVVPIFL